MRVAWIGLTYTIAEMPKSVNRQIWAFVNIYDSILWKKRMNFRMKAIFSINFRVNDTKISI